MQSPTNKKSKGPKGPFTHMCLEEKKNKDLARGHLHEGYHGREKGTGGSHVKPKAPLRIKGTCPMDR